ncbi:MAG: radical SAM protein [Candidatus Aenigmarchaeota archaeon]|nr:radical SAM protein [Candidatus Aenigmarchaeota archaeon]
MVNAYSQAIVHSIRDVDKIATSPYVKDYTLERKQALLDVLQADEGETVQVLKFHQSLCPGCVDDEKWTDMKIDCITYVKDNKVWMIKNCPEHGKTKEVYWADWEMYKKAERFQDPGIKILNPNIDKSQFEIDCPTDCGLCVEHESHTGLGNVVLTNRCDLTCWYCFFYAKEGEPIYEPTLDQIKFMLRRMRNVKPIGANAVQLTGGEPTLREDLIDIVKAAHEIGYDHVQLNTNGINLSMKPELAMKLKEAGSHVLYMSFDGMTPQTNPKNYWEAQGAMDSCRKAGIGIVLVPTVIGGVNDHELGDIIRFGMGNIDVIRSVNFQPVSLVGRMPEKLRKEQRITIPGSIKRIEEQTDGQIGREHWFPVPCAKQVTDFIEALKQEPKYRLSIHFACGMATYAFKDNDKMIPLTKFFDVEGFFDYLGELTRELNSSRHRSIRKYVVLSKLLVNMRKYVDNSQKPKNLKFMRMLMGAMQGGNYHGLADFHHNSLFVGMMHFQDPYNWDIDRIHKCDIHYATPDGRIMPFCTFNVIPELYRDRIQRKFSIPAAEWEKKTGKKLIDDKHHRKLTPEQIALIKANFDKHRRSLVKVKPTPDWGLQAVEQAVTAITQPAQGSGFIPLGQVGKHVSAKRPTTENPAGSFVSNSGSCGTCAPVRVAE